MSTGERGSVVIEAMIAALIIAGLAAALSTTVRSDAVAARAISDRRRALMVARSVLAAAGASGPVAPGVREGLEDGLAWRFAAEPLPASDGPSGIGVVERVTISVRLNAAGARPLVLLPSLRLGQ